MSDHHSQFLEAQRRRVAEQAHRSSQQFADQVRLQQQAAWRQQQDYWQQQTQARRQSKANDDTERAAEPGQSQQRHLGRQRMSLWKALVFLLVLAGMLLVADYFSIDMELLRDLVAHR